MICLYTPDERGQGVSGKRVGRGGTRADLRGDRERGGVADCKGLENGFFIFHGVAEVEEGKGGSYVIKFS